MFDDDGGYDYWEPLDDMEEWERNQLANDHEGDDLNWDDDFDGPLGDDTPSDYEADTPLGQRYADGFDDFGD